MPYPVRNNSVNARKTWRQTSPPACAPHIRHKSAEHHSAHGFAIATAPRSPAPSFDKDFEFPRRAPPAPQSAHAPPNSTTSRAAAPSRSASTPRKASEIPRLMVTKPTPSPTHRTSTKNTPPTPPCPIPIPTRTSSKPHQPPPPPHHHHHNPTPAPTRHSRFTEQFTPPPSRADLTSALSNYSNPPVSNFVPQAEDLTRPESGLYLQAEAGYVPFPRLMMDERNGKSEFASRDGASGSSPASTGCNTDAMSMSVQGSKRRRLVDVVFRRGDRRANYMQSPSPTRSVRRRRLRFGSVWGRLYALKEGVRERLRGVRRLLPGATRRLNQMPGVVRSSAEWFGEGSTKGRSGFEEVRGKRPKVVRGESHERMDSAAVVFERRKREGRAGERGQRGTGKGGSAVPSRLGSVVSDEGEWEDVGSVRTGRERWSWASGSGTASPEPWTDMAAFVSAEALSRGMRMQSSRLVVRSVQRARQSVVVRPPSVRSVRTDVLGMPERVRPQRQVLAPVVERSSTPMMPGAWVDDEEDEFFDAREPEVRAFV